VAPAQAVRHLSAVVRHAPASSALRLRRSVAALALLLLLVLFGPWTPPACEARADDPAPAPSAPAADAAVAAVPPAQPRTIRIDGKFDDWPATAFLAADERYLYVRIALPAERNLQAASQPLAIAIDLQPERTFVPDLRVVFAPRATDGLGVAVEATGAAGTAGIGHAAVDLVAAPTVAARAFELRVARDVRGRPDLTALFTRGAVRVQASTLRADGSPAWRSRAWQLELPPRDASAPPAQPSVATLPPAPPGGVRVVSWNVLLASPRKKPEPFARVLRALRPDVLLLQEWEDATDEELASWLDLHVPGAPAWTARTSDGWGVAVAARGVLGDLVARRVERPAAAPAEARRADAALRLASGVIDGALGPLCVASLHLKCCGAAGSPQDLARRAEAQAVNAALHAARTAHDEACLLVLGGDLNLVGSSEPLATLAAGLDAAGGALAAVESPVLGDGALYTWSQRWSRFSPGRLDYLLYDDGAAVLHASFVLDTRRLADDVLAAHGLERSDAAASDHLPLVLDLVPQSGSSSGFANSRLRSPR